MNCLRKNQKNKDRKSIYLYLSLIAAALIIFTAGCTDGGIAQSFEKGVPERVVALGKSNAQLWLLSGGELVGVTDDVKEAGLAKSAASVGGLEHVSVEAIAELSPDLVLYFETDSAHREIASKLAALGINTDAINIDTFDDYKEKLREYTAFTGRDDLYGIYAQQLEKRIEEIVKASEDKRNELYGKSYILLQISGTKTKLLKNDHFISEIINSLGLVNSGDDNSALSDISIEYIAQANPDYIFAVFRGSEEKAGAVFEEQFLSQSVWKSLKSVGDNHVYVLPKEMYAYKPNEKWDEAYEYIYQLFDSQEKE